MSFKMLKDEVIDKGLCQGCALCAGYCKHIVIEGLKPELDDFCILERNGQSCGKCYASCPQVKHDKYKDRIPLDMVAVQSTDEHIREDAVSGGFITALNKYLLEEKKVSQLIEVQNVDDRPKPVLTTDPKETEKYAGIAYGRSGTLQKLVETLGEEHETVGFVGVPCEITGAAKVEEGMKTDIFKIGLFCNANIGNEVDEYGVVHSPCRHSCPSGVNAAGYVHLIQEKKYQEAVDLIREENPLPSVCGRVCTHECEYNCTLIGTNHPIAIRELKKFITDWEIENSTEWEQSKPEGKKVAIIGAGPAGLTAAYYLATKGYRPTIFESSDTSGGMLHFGIPEFRLPAKVLEHDVKFIESKGVEIKYNTPIGPDLTFADLKKDGYEAIFISIGQYKPRSFKLEGEDLDNVHMAIDFLLKRKYRQWDHQHEFKDKVVGIMGAGPVAVDVGQTALRLGAKKIIMIDIVKDEQLFVSKHEIPDNEKQYFEWRTETNTTKFSQTEDGKLAFNSHKIKWITGDDGRKSFEKIEGSDEQIIVDSVVIAVGQVVDYDLLNAAGGDQLNLERGHIKVDETTFETNLPGIFAGGDIIARGKNVAIAAISHGKEAAKSIDLYLRGENIKTGRRTREQSFFGGPLKAPKDVSKKPTVEISSENLWMNFSEVDGIFNEDMALLEASRCLQCNNFCSHCQDFAAVNADLTAGDIGSDKDYTTVILWTDRARDIVKDMLDKGLIKQGTISKSEIDEAIASKLRRNLVEFKKSPRDAILSTVNLKGTGTISSLSKELGLPIKQVRYNALRLAQSGKLSMELNEELGEPVFSMPKLEE